VRSIALATILAAVGLVSAAGSAPAVTGDPCAPLVNPVACENSKPGNPGSEWQVNGAGDPSIQGYATDMSVNQGERVRFKVKTNASNYTINIFRLGYYQGLGARKVSTVMPSASLPQSQPVCLTNASTGLIDCGNWAESASWQVPADAVSGIYVAHLRRGDTGGESQIVFVVRDDDSSSDVFFQTSDATWQAYNAYGGNSLYTGSPAGRAYKVSYNRPFLDRDGSAHSYLYSAEYPMLRWLEANGYDVSYTTNVDSERRGTEIREHRVFLSVGHDEYWSAGIRANVEAALASGVNLAFFSGNEVFWKTRWESSIDGSSTPNRTLVCYKETLANAKIDPSPVWTGTWRDPRFSPPADGGRAENALTGTLFMVNGYREDAITVPAEFRDLRIWRNTAVASLAPGSVATFPDGTLGYEWDEDVQNATRPPGLLRLSSTTLNVPAKLQDNGSTYAAGTAIHALTMYRAHSGALVFGAGTLQWSWGLDDEHDVVSGTPPRPPSTTMRQATVNLLADMNAQPGTLQSGLVAASRTTDTVQPTTSITSPSAGAAIASGSTITISGTATDSGGTVGGVEVSTDGGATWRVATGRSSWTYTWNAAGFGAVTLKARAIDDSGNIQSAPASVQVNVSCPCSLWGATTPGTTASTDTRAVELGLKFQSEVDGKISGIRFYKGTGNTGSHVGSLWTSTGTLLARAAFTGETAAGWQQVTFDTPVPVTAGTTYIASYFAPAGRYAIDRDYFASSSWDKPPLHALRDGLDGGNGVFAYGASPTFPIQTSSSSNYWVDVLFVTQVAPDTTPPTITTTSPVAGFDRMDTRGAVTATFSEGINSATVTGTSFELRDSAGVKVPAAIAYNAATRTASLQPAGPLAYTSSYTATVKGGGSGVKDLAGNALAADYTWSFTTLAPGQCPCTMWTGADRPAVESNGDTGAVELGVKFRTDADGFITGIRFYKSTVNTGTHRGSLWTRAGQLLARATFSGESASGWQQVAFEGPVAVQADTTYVASYYAPAGGYSYTRDYFTTTYDKPPLRGLQDGLDGVNGLYLYASSPTFPTNGVSATNYWVDPVFERTAPPDTVPPSVTSVSPASGATGAAVTPNVTASFGEAMRASSINGTNFQLRDGNGALVPAVVTWDDSQSRAVLDPVDPLLYGGLYTATLKGGSTGVTDVAGNGLASDYTWSFQTKMCPCSIWPVTAMPDTASSPDTNSVELGVKFRVETPGYITGLRFYKGPGNTGTHVGTLWSSNGTMLRRATFTGESATGWQTVSLATPVAVTPNTTYVASYHANNGGYSVSTTYFTTTIDNPPVRALADSEDGGNGVFAYGATPVFPDRSSSSRNYWVDVLFDRTAPADSTRPTVTAVLPAAGATGVSVAADVTATFSESLDPATVGPATFELRDGSGALVPAAVFWDGSASQAKLDPVDPLVYGATYTAKVKGGASGVKDPAGNALAADFTWSFQTRACPCTIWSDTARPETESSPDTNAVELGVKFRADVNGFIVGLRFYKGPANTGTHVGSLWSSTGTLLARTTFTGETASGWQNVMLATPVTITAGTTYVASYHMNTGGYSVTTDYFGSAVVNSPLRALADGTDGPNAVFAYDPNPTFPDRPSSARNYWVDVIYRQTVP
jgi:hypothetical protein